MNFSDPPLASFVTVVSGLPRSGTSLLMQMLSAGGLPVLADQVRGADESNPRGYLEFEPVKRLRADPSFLAQARGRAVKIIHLLLPELPTGGALQYRVLLMKRPIEEVLESQRVMLARQGKLSANSKSLADTYRRQMEQVEKWMSAQEVFSFLSLHYHEVLKDPAKLAGRVNSFLGMDLSIPLMAKAVDLSLYRQRSGTALPGS